MERSKAEVIAGLTDPGLIAVVRARSAEQIMPLADALIAGGIIAIEITLTTPGAVGAIRDARRRLGTRAIVGAGTVLDAGTCRAVLEAGAEFVVTPICRPELVPLAQAGDRPIMLGAFSPTEAQTAHEAGADFIKLFPADTLGPGYLKALLAPLPHLRFVPTGGIDLDNVTLFFQAGCAAVGLGSSLVSAEVLQRSAWAELTARAERFVRAVRAARGR